MNKFNSSDKGDNMFLLSLIIIFFSLFFNTNDKDKNNDN